VLGRALRELRPLGSAGVVERNWKLALEAAFEVVSRLTVAGQVNV
jgi:hypothetical protein